MAYTEAIKHSTPEMVRKAYAEYVKSVQSRWNNLVQLQAAVIDATDEEALTAAEVNALITTAGLTATAPVPLTNGTFDTLTNYLVEISRATAAASVNGAINEPVTGVVSAGGSPVPVTLQSVLTDMNKTLHAITVEFAVATGYVQGGSTAEIVATARDVLNSTFTSSYTDVSNSLTLAIDKIRSGMNFNQYVATMMRDSGVDTRAVSSVDFNSSQYATFTGASPAGAFSFNTLGAGIASTVQQACTIAKNILGPIVNVGVQLFNRAAKAVTETLVNPYDIKELDVKTEAYTFDGLFADATQTVNAGVYPALDSKLSKGRAMHFDFIPGEILIQGQPNISYTIRSQVKLKPISNLVYNEFNTLVTTYGTNPWPQADLVAIMDKLLTGSVSAYNNLDVPEIDMWRGLIMSSVLTKFCIFRANQEVTGVAYTNIDVMTPAELTAWGKTTVTNLDFLQILTQTGSFATPDTARLAGYQLSTLFSMINGVLAEQASNPLNPPFWPYQHDFASWFTPRFGLKSDQDNQTAFNNFVAAAIVIVGVAVIAGSAIIFLKNLALKMNLQAQGAIWNATEAASKGQLTPAHIAAVKKANFKANVTGWLSGNLTNAVGSASGSAAQGPSNADVLSLIR